MNLSVQVRTTQVYKVSRYLINVEGQWGLENKLTLSFYSRSWVLCPRPWVEYEYDVSLYSNSTHHQNSCTRLMYFSSHLNRVRSCLGYFCWKPLEGIVPSSPVFWSVCLYKNRNWTDHMPDWQTKGNKSWRAISTPANSPHTTQGGLLLLGFPLR
jgi:hypothetical protein